MDYKPGKCKVTQSHRYLFARDQVYASIGVKGRLQEDRLIAAVLLLLQAFPALGARLDLQGVPSLDMGNPGLPLSCTSGRRDQQKS